MSSQWYFVSLEAFGQSYPGANYEKGSTVQDAYLRWIPCVGARKRTRKRVASNHLRLGFDLSDSEPTYLSDSMPSSVDTATIWSSQHYEEDCVICRHIRTTKKGVEDSSKTMLDAQVQQYHRADVLPIPVAHTHDVPLDEIMTHIDCRDSTYTSFPSGCHSDRISTADSGKEPVHEEVPHSSEDTPPPSSGYPDGREKLTTLSPQRAVSPTRYVPLPTAAAGDQKYEQSARNLDDLHVQSSQYMEVDIQSLHEERPDGLHQVVEDLAAVVRKLAVQVRGNADSIASLAAVVKDDHEALAKMCEQQDKMCQHQHEVLYKVAAALERK